MQRFEGELLILLLRRERKAVVTQLPRRGGPNPAAPFSVNNSDPTSRRVFCMSGKPRTRDILTPCRTLIREIVHQRARDQLWVHR
jgi:hypothetical protein